LNLEVSSELDVFKTAGACNRNLPRTENLSNCKKKQRLTNLFDSFHRGSPFLDFFFGGFICRLSVHTILLPLMLWGREQLIVGGGEQFCGFFKRCQGCVISRSRTGLQKIVQCYFPWTDGTTSGRSRTDSMSDEPACVLLGIENSPSIAASVRSEITPRFIDLAGMGSVISEAFRF
jgi:hypothetical protein